MFMLWFVCMYSPYTPSRLMEYSKISPTHPILRKRIFFTVTSCVDEVHFVCLSVYSVRN